MEYVLMPKQATQAVIEAMQKAVVEDGETCNRSGYAAMYEKAIEAYDGIRPVTDEYMGMDRTLYKCMKSYKGELCVGNCRNGCEVPNRLHSSYRTGFTEITPHQHALLCAALRTVSAIHSQAIQAANGEHPYGVYQAHMESIKQYDALISQICEAKTIIVKG